MRLGEILIAARIVSRAQLAQALQEQAARPGQRLGSHVQHLGFATSDQIALALAKQLGVPPALLRHLEGHDAKVATLIGAKIAITHSLVPIAFSRTGGRRLVICFRDPHQPELIARLEKALGAPVTVCVAAESTIRKYLRSIYGSQTQSHGAVAQPAPQNVGFGNEETGLGALELVDLDHRDVFKVAPKAFVSHTQQSSAHQATYPPQAGSVPMAVAPVPVAPVPMAVPMAAAPVPVAPVPVAPVPMAVPMAAAPVPVAPVPIAVPMAAAPVPVAPVPIAVPMAAAPVPVAPVPMAAAPVPVAPVPVAMAVVPAATPAPQHGHARPGQAIATGTAPLQAAPVPTPTPPAIAAPPPAAAIPTPPQALSAAPVVIAPRPPAPTINVRPPKQQPAKPAWNELDDLLSAIIQADKRSSVGDSIMNFLEQRFAAGIMFTVKDGLAMGHRGFGGRLSDQDTVTALMVPLQRTVLGAAHDSQELWQGDPSTISSAAQERFLTLFDLGHPPVDVVVAPVAVSGRVLCLLYAHSRDGQSIDEALVDDLDEIAEATRRSFARIIHQAKTSTSR